MRTGRIDYRMRRRASLGELRDGVRSVQDVCDAHPELVRAGRNIGAPAREPCPVCEDPDALRHVTYIFTGKGGRRGEGGRAVTAESLGRQAARLGDLAVYTVEVCTACGWHHLLESYWLRASGKAVG